MTIAIAVRVNDGIVLAADSASTHETEAIEPSDREPPTIYNNANKIINLCKGLPIGVTIWGQGSLGEASMPTLLKDLRAELSRPAGNRYGFNRESYDLLGVAEIVKDFFFTDHITPAKNRNESVGPIGILVSGYSSNRDRAASFVLEFEEDGVCDGVRAMSPNELQCIDYFGQQDAISRLVLGVGLDIVNAIEVATRGELDEDDAKALAGGLATQLRKAMVKPYMPIQDAIDLAEFLAVTSANFIRFTQGARVVGGPIEIAAITKHEGFKWVRRKFYYDRNLNPDD